MLYFGLSRILSRGYYRWRRLLRELAARSGGNVYTGHRRRFFYVSPQNDVEIEVRRIWTSLLTIRVRKPFAFPAVTLQRVPRLLFAFFEAFIPSSYRINSRPYIAHCADGLSNLTKRPGFDAAFNRISRAGFSVKLGSSGLKLWKPIGRYDSGNNIVEEYIRLARDFAQVCSCEFVEIPVHAIPSEQHCAYCKELLTENAPVTKCATCGTPQHTECFQLNGKCSVFGCESPARAPELIYH